MRQIHLERIESTKRQAAKLAERGAPPPFVVFAEEEERVRRPDGTQGVLRGGGLYCTCACAVKEESDRLNAMPLIAALLVAKAIEQDSEANGGNPPLITLAWPNRIVIDRLVAGRTSVHRLFLPDNPKDSRRVVLVTVRCFITPKSLRESMGGEEAVSAAGELAGLRAEADSVGHRFAESLPPAVLSLAANGVSDHWNRQLSPRMLGLGAGVRIHHEEDGTVEGRFESIDPLGGVVMTTDTGVVVRRRGDFRVLRSRAAE